MARLAFGGFEANHVHLEGGSLNNSATIGSTSPHGGTYALQCASGGGNAAQSYTTPAFVIGTGPAHVRAHVRFANLPGTATTVLRFQTTSVSARVTSGGKLQLWNDTGTPAQIGSDSAATLTTGTYYRIELRFTAAAAGSAAAQLLLDGVTVATGTSLTVTATQPTTAQMGWVTAPGANLTCQVDCWAVNDAAAGTGQTGYPGPGTVVILKPISDSARDAGWIGGAGGTTNLWGAVDNTPPTGVATASATDTSQNENAVSTTTEAYSANLQTYTTGGLASGDVVAVAAMVTATGTSSLTSTNECGIQITSNPAIGEVVISVEASGATSNTYPTGWGRDVVGMTHAPSVTNGTSPVMRIRKNTAATRIHQVCFMGLMIDYYTGPTTIAVPTATATGAGGVPTDRAIVAVPVATVSATARAVVLPRLPTTATATGTAPTPTPRLVVKPPTATVAAQAWVIANPVSAPMAGATARALTPVIPNRAVVSWIETQVPDAGPLTIAVPVAPAIAAGQEPTIPNRGILSWLETQTPSPFGTIEVPTATATGAAGVPTVRAIVPEPTATATGDALVPTIVSGGGAATTVLPPAATATGDGVAPTIVASVPVPTATATGTGQTPTLQTIVPGAVASATGAASAPTILAVVAVPTATATGSALAPTLPQLAVVATATASAPTPTIQAIIGVPTATVTATAPTPTIQSGGGVIQIPAATATGAGVSPGIVAIVPAAVAAASGMAIAPTTRLVILPPASVATGDALVPTLLGLATFVQPPTATATGTANVPTVIGSGTFVAVPTAAASGLANTPTLAVLVAVPTATATGTAHSITSYVLVPVATATGAAQAPTIELAIASIVFEAPVRIIILSAPSVSSPTFAASSVSSTFLSTDVDR